MTDFGLIETIRVSNGYAMFLSDHTNRLIQSLQLLKINIDSETIFRKISNYIQQECKIQDSQNIRLRIQVKINETRIVEWLVSSQKLYTSTFEINKIPLKIGFYDETYKEQNIHSNLKSTDRLIYDKAKKFALENSFDDVLVFNSEKVLSDAIIYNVFIVKENQIYTSRIKDAPIDGVLRQFLLKHIRSFTIIEKALYKEEIEQADEIFLTNAVRGIQTVGQIGDKKLDNRITLNIYKEFISLLDKTMN
ncbi:MAG TPA: aminotransferase class IV [Chitinophagales bacterium]|nr:aminotransferase class IV [Chitinophagales bacterium]HNB39557.1 aminotransferase class IV [Chitinophagales bacterium]HNJ10410.1 aminotransferase class IV [Chitinophagales bacterium]